MVVQSYRYIVGFLILVGLGVWISVFQIPDEENLKIIACDVGQGDAILIIKGSIQILTDGGPNRKVLDCLNKYMPFYDRDIELVILTHPDSDHSEGLIDVIKRYNIGALVENSINPGTQVYQALENVVRSKGVKVIRPDMDITLRLDMIYLDILHPSDDFESTKTNDYSIVYKLRYDNFKAIFTGDIDQKVSDSLINNPGIEDVDYIKIPHHGSRNGLTLNLLKALMPETAVISLSKNNSYGHPHKEILEMLSQMNVRVLRTDEMGDIEIETDGNKYWEL